jgi:hypothetical protein
VERLLGVRVDSGVQPTSPVTEYDHRVAGRRVIRTGICSIVDEC